MEKPLLTSDLTKEIFGPHIPLLEDGYCGWKELHQYFSKMSEFMNFDDLAVLAVSYNEAKGKSDVKSQRSRVFDNPDFIDSSNLCQILREIYRDRFGRFNSRKNISQQNKHIYGALNPYGQTLEQRTKAIEEKHGRNFIQSVKLKLLSPAADHRIDSDDKLIIYCQGITELYLEYPRFIHLEYLKKSSSKVKKAKKPIADQPELELILPIEEATPDF